MVVLCIGAGILNIVFNTINLDIFKFPLYFDTIMTVSMTLLAGPVYGAITGASTNIITNIIDFKYWGWTGNLFAICNIATALITWLFVRFFPHELSIGQKTYGTNFSSRRFETAMNRLIVLILLSFALCLAMSILGGLISTFMQYVRSFYEVEDPNPAAAKLGATLFHGELPLVLVQILSRIPVNIIDRLVTTFAGYIIARLLYFPKTST